MGEVAGVDCLDEVFSNITLAILGNEFDVRSLNESFPHIFMAITAISPAPAVSIVRLVACGHQIGRGDSRNDHKAANLRGDCQSLTTVELGHFAAMILDAVVRDFGLFPIFGNRWFDCQQMRNISPTLIFSQGHPVTGRLRFSDFGRITFEEEELEKRS